MSEPLEIAPLGRPLDVDVEVPGSKSYTNRAFVLAALADGTSHLSGALFSDDTLYMAEALRQLGVAVEADPERKTFQVAGSGGCVPAETARVSIGNAGTAARFLPVVMALGRGVYELDGIPRMRERPITPLVDALGELGTRVECLAEPGCIPLRVHGGTLRGGRVTLPGHLTSQYVSGLLMGAPRMPEGLALDVEGEMVSRPYLEMAVRAMRDFGAEVETDDYRHFAVAGGQRYAARDYAVEPDASGASYFFAAAAIAGGRVRVRGLGADSLQGDLGLVDVLADMGCEVERGPDWTEVRRGPSTPLRGVDVAMHDLSDVAQTLAVVAPFATSPTRIRGIGFIRRKETDRIAAVVSELTRLGIDAEEEEDGLVVHPGKPRAADVETYDDHRMAMSFALIGLACEGVRILDPGCTAKTFPDYFERLDRLRA